MNQKKKIQCEWRRKIIKKLITKPTITKPIKVPTYIEDWDDIEEVLGVEDYEDLEVNQYGPNNE